MKKNFVLLLLFSLFTIITFVDSFPSDWRLCVVKFKLKEKQKSITNPNHVKPLWDQHQVREGFPNISGTG